MTIMSNPRIRACLSVPAFLYMSLTVPAAAQWMTNGVEASATSNHAVEPEISVDTFGGALVV
jgi:hypothetical protein